MIDIKIVAGRFVTCFPMPTPTREQLTELTFGQRVMTSKKAREARQRMSGPADSNGLLGYALTKADQEHSC
jgi:hypothetical protein